MKRKAKGIRGRRLRRKQREGERQKHEKACSKEEICTANNF